MLGSYSDIRSDLILTFESIPISVSYPIPKVLYPYLFCTYCPIPTEILKRLSIEIYEDRGVKSINSDEDQPMSVFFFKIY